jgi:signal transduction histidine kinase
LQDGFATLADLTRLYGDLREAAEAGRITDQLLDEIRAAETDADLPYLISEIPRAIEQSLDGVARVTRIVQAMKEVAHHGLADPCLADINQALSSTLIVATSELKYVADIETDFGHLPLVLCRIDELNQVFLNLLVNAAHAIADANNGTGDQRGTIRVSTRQEGADALVTIADTGAGIPEAIRTKVFDQFFTTKEVGRGTGQGLPLARSVVEKHGGSLSFDSTIGHGTAFHIRIPVNREADARGGEAA